MTEPHAQSFTFISYARADHDQVMQLQNDLQAQGVKVWIDKEGLQPGTADWEETLRSVIRDAYAVLLVASPNARSSRYVKDELRVAEMYERPVYPFWITGSHWIEAIPLGWGGTQYIDAREQRYEVALHELVTALKGLSSTLASGATPSTEPEPDFEPRNPYKGLKSFTGADARDFFGRDSLIHAMVETLKESLALDKQDVQSARLLAVVGPSGSGKSSVVMAGLLPRLRNGELPGSKEWIYLEPIMPGKHPIEALVLTLAEKLPDRSLKSIREDLEDDSARGLHLLAITLAKPHKTKTALVVDQFEELFTQTATEDERRHFIDLLVTAITEPGGPLIVILTLRADFYDRPIRYPELAQLIGKHQQLMLPMDVKDLRAVIEQPAELPDVRLIFEGDLVGDLLFEMRGQEGALPLLEFTLDQLFERRNGHLLTVQAYHEIGGIKGALTKHTEDTYAALPSEEQRRLARALFMRLIDPGATALDTTRRRATLSEFSLADATQNRLLQETIDAFIAARLLVTNEIAGTITLEVSHEALIREWKRLSDWLSVAREDVLLQKTISEDAVEWEKHKKPRDRLYRGSQLKDAQAWAGRNLPSGNEEAFLQASAIQRRRFIVSVIAIVLLLLSTTGLTAWVLTRPSPNPTVVTTTNDDGTGSLRRVVTNANPGSTITFDASLHGSTIMLTSGDLNITKNLRILGQGAGTIAISSGKHGFEIKVQSNASVTISNLTFVNSDATEGFITNAGTLTLTHCIIFGNSADQGGGIDNDHGTLTIDNSTISHNMGISGGGGITNFHGKVTLTNSVVSSNSSLSGGGIYNDGGTLALTNSMVSGNTSSIGGGIYNLNGKVILTSSTVSDNTIDTTGPDANGGGGVYNIDGVLTFTNSTISDNTAILDGGGIAINGGQANITFCTIYDNISTNSNGGGVATEIAFDYKPAHVVMRNSIVAGNYANSGQDITGTLTTYGYNLIQDFSGVTFVDPLKMHSTDMSGNTFTGLKIDTGLQKTGGLTPTHALLPGSPAIDKIPLNDCIATLDQRGMKRPDDDERFCDIGAYESST